MDLGENLPRELTHFEAHSNEFTLLLPFSSSTNKTENNNTIKTILDSSPSSPSSFSSMLDLSLLPRSLIRFTLHHNKIGGGTTLGDLSQLPPKMSVFDISVNNFCGELVGLENLPIDNNSDENNKAHLSTLNLSFNNFTGKLVDGTRVKTAEEFISRLPSSLKNLDLRGQQQMMTSSNEQQQPTLHLRSPSSSHSNSTGLDVTELLPFVDQYPALVLSKPNNNNYSSSSSASTTFSPSSSRTPSKMR